MARANARGRKRIRSQKQSNRALPPQRGLAESGLHAAIVTSPSWVGGELSLREDLRMAKSALLYMDTVELYSYAATLTVGLANAGQAGERTLFEFIDQLPPAARVELGLSPDFRDRTANPSQADRDRLCELLSSRHTFAGSEPADELDWLASEGLLVIKSDGFSVTSGSDEDHMPYTYLLEGLLADPATRPLFDRHVAATVRRIVSLSSSDVDARVVRHSREGALGTALVAQLQAFPDADIPSILDARRELADPLTFYREAVARAARTIRADSWDWDRFDADVDDLIRDEIEPAKARLRAAIEESTLASRIGRGARATATGLGVAGAAGSFTVALGNLVPELVRYLADAGPAAVAALATSGGIAKLQASATGQAAKADLSQSGYYYLLELERRL